jgi:hypothetical protein
MSACEAQVIAMQIVDKYLDSTPSRLCSSNLLFSLLKQTTPVSGIIERSLVAESAYGVHTDAAEKVLEARPNQNDKGVRARFSSPHNKRPPLEFVLQQYMPSAWKAIQSFRGSGAHSLISIPEGYVRCCTHSLAP